MKKKTKKTKQLTLNDKIVLWRRLEKACADYFNEERMFEKVQRKGYVTDFETVALGRIAKNLCKLGHKL